MAESAEPRHQGPGIIEQLLKIRYLAIVVVVLAILHALAFLFLGAKSAFAAYGIILGVDSHGPNARPGLELLHSLDFLLVSLVLIILGLGVAKLFLLPPTAEHSPSLPSWLHIDTFSDLKALLWETILTALLMVALSELTSTLAGELTWSALVIPGAIFLLALGLYFMKRA
jgi:uncharacterized membrane protein YqhA